MQNVDKNTFLTIDLRALEKNFNKIKKKVGSNCIVAATVKADAYGLGVKEVVPALIKSGCKNFFVATTNEALELRKINKYIKIYILNGLIAKDIRLIKENKLIPIINSLDQLKKIETFQKNNRLRLDIGLHFDTGMSRLGFDQGETNLLIKNKKKFLKNSKIKLVMSHLACANNKKSKKNIDQLNKYMEIIKDFPNSKYSISNSAGILLGKKYHLDMVRPGISLYGGHCQDNEKNIYENIISLRAKFIQIKNIKKNDTVGYGATYKAKAKMKIGTLGFGYADGFNRLFSNNFNLRYKNKKLQLIGRVSMDLVTVNLTNVKNKVDIKNDSVEIIGNTNSINSISQQINTIPYEILTSLGKRYERIYIS